MIKWCEHLATGIEIVDCHHKRIIELVSAFESTLRNDGPDRGLVEMMLTTLVEHARAHFAEEEALMGFCGVDSRHIHAHTREHRSFLDDMVQLATQLDDATSQRLHEISEDLVRFISAWLMLHVVSMDQAMAGQIRAIDSGSTAAEAFNGLHSSRNAASNLRALLHSVLDLWRDALEQCRRLEARLAALTPSASTGVQLPRWPQFDHAGATRPVAAVTRTAREPLRAAAR